ncbi:reductase [Ameca splendens]|uniref:3-ketoacyl-[acyl-carrier-protein] reductase beta subunit n=1 Tax=Ameca splendens TaxID=208324 RepID=A0ABV0XFM3_9TELE
MTHFLFSSRGHQIINALVHSDKVPRAFGSEKGPEHHRSYTVLNTMSRLAVVCGGSRGIGQAVSRLLGERGCRVAVVSRNQDTAQAAVAALDGADHKAFSCDVSKEHLVQETFETIQKTCGNISYLVNAAGINRWAAE